jgi:hypothetical protein
MKNNLVLLLGFLAVFGFVSAECYAQSAKSTPYDATGNLVREMADSIPLLKQIYDDYKNDPKLFDSKWKGKQIEITVKIVFLDKPNIMVEQILGSGYYSARIQFKDPKSYTLALNYEEVDSEIKIRGTITEIVPNGESIDHVEMRDCIIIQ